MEFQKLCLCLTIVQLREIQFHRACLKKNYLSFTV